MLRKRRRSLRLPFRLLLLLPRNKKFKNYLLVLANSSKVLMRSQNSTRLKERSTQHKLERKVSTRLRHTKNKRRPKRSISRLRPLELLIRLLRKVLASSNL